MTTFADHGIDVNGHTGEVNAQCPQCSHTRNKSKKPCLRVNTDKGVWLCHHCGWSGGLAENGNGRKHKRPTLDIKPPTDVALEWILGRGINRGVLDRNGVGSVTYAGQPALAFPYRVHGQDVNCKYRMLADKSFAMEAGCERVLYKFDDLDDAGTIVVEGEIDALSLEVAGFLNVVSVPNGAPGPSAKNLDGQMDFLSNPRLHQVEKWILAVDADGPGWKLEQELARRLGRAKCFRVVWPEGCKDANDVLRKCGKEALADCIRDAAPYPVVGIYGVTEAAPKIHAFHEHGMPRGAATGWSILDEFYTVKPGWLTVVTGVPSHGKTTFVEALAVNLATRANWSFAMFSPENQPPEYHLSAILTKYLNKPFGGHLKMSKEELEYGIGWAKKHFWILQPETPSVDEILALSSVLVRREGIKGLIIDPWNEIEHARPKDLSETEYVGKSLGAIKRFAIDNDVHVWVIAHPMKMMPDKMTGKRRVPTPYDINGSANFYNKADCCICVHRDSDLNDLAHIHIQKVRFRVVGKPGHIQLLWDRETGRYHER